MASKSKELKKIVRFKNGVNPKVMEFVLAQTNFSEAITYLIEKELYENGLRDLVKYVPMLRTTEYFDTVQPHEPAKELESDEIPEPIQKAQEKPITLSGKMVEVDIEEEKKSDGNVLEQCFDD